MGLISQEKVNMRRIDQSAHGCDRRGKNMHTAISASALIIYYSYTIMADIECLEDQTRVQLYHKIAISEGRIHAMTTLSVGKWKAFRSAADLFLPARNFWTLFIAIIPHLIHLRGNWNMFFLHLTKRITRIISAYSLFMSFLSFNLNFILSSRPVILPYL